jgi:hypothetical protein
MCRYRLQALMQPNEMGRLQMAQVCAGMRNQDTALSNECMYSQKEEERNKKKIVRVAVKERDLSTTLRSDSSNAWLVCCSGCLRGRFDSPWMTSGTEST